MIARDRIGLYELRGKLGEGGMGEVYRARDSRLGRDVALKILPASVAADPDRIVRFKREAQLLASLNHPNVAAIYGLEESDGLTALVLELVDGPTLADRIAQGPIPIDEACHIARQIADGLEAAHAQGIVHRDLKPANIKVTADDKVKVLDFGLAKALDPASVGSMSDASISPTLTSPTMTRAGVILGTAAYMAPEQARGKAVDKRADVWAFGCVLYEMLTAHRAFAADEVSDTLAMVLMKDVDWTRLPSDTPPGVRRVLRRCLERDRARRLADIADARLELEETSTAAADDTGAVSVRTVAPFWRRALPWTVAALALLALTAALLRAPKPDPSSTPSVPARMELMIGTDAVVNSVAISPDGDAVVAAAASVGRPSMAQLFVRRMNDLEARPLSGTEGANYPFFSPDGQWIGFFSNGKLRKVSAAGGAVVTLADVQGARGGAWIDSDTIVFNPGSLGGSGPLLAISAARGAVRPFTTVANTQQADRWPQRLPGGRAVLYTSADVVFGFNEATIMIQPLPAGEPRAVYKGGFYGRYLPGGYLSFIHDGTLFAAKFDLDRLELTGSPVPLLERVQTNPQFGSAVIDAAANGTVIYLPTQGDTASSAAPISWLDRSGKFTLLRPPSAWGTPQFSPDGGKLAFSVIEKGQTDIWTYEWARGISTPLTFDAANDAMPVWTPDGQRVAFGSQRGGAVMNLYWQRADRSGTPQRLTENTSPQLPGSFHPNGRLLAYHQGAGGGDNNRQDILVLPIEGDEKNGWKPGKPIEFLGGPFRKVMPMFSPDGKWLAYSSNEGGSFEIYVTPYPGPGPKVQVSNQGGTNPRWSKVRPELFFSQGSADGATLMVASYSTAGDVFRAEKPKVWTETRFPISAPVAIYGSNFALHPDGQRFAVPPQGTTGAAGAPSRLVVMFNAIEELQQVAGGHAQR